jgi:hypothetical protein
MYPLSATYRIPLFIELAPCCDSDISLAGSFLSIALLDDDDAFPLRLAYTRLDGATYHTPHGFTKCNVSLRAIDDFAIALERRCYCATSLMPPRHHAILLYL